MFLNVSKTIVTFKKYSFRGENQHIKQIEDRQNTLRKMWMGRAWPLGPLGDPLHTHTHTHSQKNYIRWNSVDNKDCLWLFLWESRLLQWVREIQLNSPEKERWEKFSSLGKLVAKFWGTLAIKRKLVNEVRPRVFANWCSLQFIHVRPLPTHRVCEGSL